VFALSSDGTVNPALRMHDTSNGTKSEDPKPSDGLDHAIKLFNWKRILLLIVAITVHNIPGECLVSPVGEPVNYHDASCKVH